MPECALHFQPITPSRAIFGCRWRHLEMWPRRAHDADDAGNAAPAKAQTPSHSAVLSRPGPPLGLQTEPKRQILARPAGAKPKAPLALPASTKWAPRRAVNAASTAAVKAPTAPIAALTYSALGSIKAQVSGDRRPEKRKESNPSVPAILKRPKTSAASSAAIERKRKDKMPKTTSTNSWKQRQQQWNASAKGKSAKQASEAEKEKAARQEAGFDLVFQEVFGQQKARSHQSSAHTASLSSVPGNESDANVIRTQPLAESSGDEADEDGLEQRGLALPLLASGSTAPIADRDNNHEGDDDDGNSTNDSGDEWKFTSGGGALCLDAFEDDAERDGDENATSGEVGRRAAFARWKEEDASHSVSSNFVKLNMRKRFKGSSGRAKKLPAYLRARGEQFEAGENEVGRQYGSKKKQPASASGGGALMNDGLDFIDECLQVLAKVENERANVQSNDAQESTEAASSDDPSPPRCHHGLVCQELVVKKKNKNHGRAFFACSMGFDEGRCDFFLWKENHVQLALRQLFASAPIDAVEGADFVPMDPSKSMDEQRDSLLANLRLVFGHPSFRPGQEWAISRVFEKKNTLLVLPTGAGKSLCYQLPALFLPGVTLVISPLISLMNDQFDRLPPLLKQQAACLASSSGSSSTSKAKYAEFVRDLLGGRLKLVFLSPERALSSGMQRLLHQIRSRLSLVCVDEAHCVSEWSHHFRPSYLRLGQVFRNAKCVLAMTATASHRVVQDVVQQLGAHQRQVAEGNSEEDEEDPSEMVMQLPWQRSNLKLRVRSVTSDEERTVHLCRYLTSLTTGKGSVAGGGVIIYVHQQRQTEELARVLTEQLPKLKVGYYHAKMDPELKEKTQVGFMRGKLRVVVATIAFGMGIDKQNVRGVVHFHMPSSAENYLQQVGRAGRDGKPARALLFLAKQDARLFRSLAFSNALASTQLHQLIKIVFLTTSITSEYDSVVAVSTCIDDGGESHWLTLETGWAESALDMKSATIETFLTLLAQKMPMSKISNASSAGVSLLPSGASKASVQLSDKQMRSLPGGSDLRRLLAACDPSGTTQVKHASVQHDVNGYLITSTATFHIGEMAHALFGGVSRVMTDFYSPVGEEEGEQVGREQRRLLQLLRQAQLDGLVQRVTLEAPAFYVHVRYTPNTTTETKADLVAVVAQQLFEQHESMEERQLARLARLYAALSAAAVPVAAPEDEELDEEKASALENKLSQYFQLEEVDDDDAIDQADHRLLAEVLEPLSMAMIEQIERDVRALITMMRRDVEPEVESDDELPWTSLSAARIFHGLGSPAFPVRLWRQHGCWRKYDGLAFEKLARIAERVISAEQVVVEDNC